MIGADVSDGVLMAILGERAKTLTDGEREVASLVVMWARNYAFTVDNVRYNKVTCKRLAEIIIESIEEQSELPWSEICQSSRKFTFVMYRNFALHILYKVSTLPKLYLAEFLEMKLNHSTVFHSIQRVEDWLRYDKALSEKYYGILEVVRKKMDEAAE